MKTPPSLCQDRSCHPDQRCCRTCSSSFTLPPSFSELNKTDILVTASNSDYRYPNLHLKTWDSYHTKSQPFPGILLLPFALYIYYGGAHVAAAGRSLGEKALLRIALWTANDDTLLLFASTIHYILLHLTPTASKARFGMYHFPSHFCATSLLLVVPLLCCASCGLLRQIRSYVPQSSSQYLGPFTSSILIPYNPSQYKPPCTLVKDWLRPMPPARLHSLSSSFHPKHPRQANRTSGTSSCSTDMIQGVQNLYDRKTPGPMGATLVNSLQAWTVCMIWALRLST